MLDAIRETGVHRLAAEMEIGFAWMPHEAAGANRDDFGHIGLRARCNRGRRRRRPFGCGCCGARRRFFDRLCLGLGCGLRFAFIGLHRRRARFEAKAVRLADHGIAAYAAQLVGDLAGGQALFPHGFQAIDPFVGPGHRKLQIL
jgi:hypothetical protein